MDLRLYYQKLRETSTRIPDAFPVVVSNETADGGKAGIRTEVTRAVAAKLLVEGIARLATAEETEAFRQEHAAAKQLAEQVAAAAKVQFAVLSAGELQTLRELAPSKG